MLQTIEIQPAEYRHAMAAIAEQIHLVATAGEAGRRVVAATAVTSVSDQPPTVLICLNRLLPANGIFLRNGVFSISTLGEQHRGLADACSGRTGANQEMRFAMAEWERHVTGAPILADAIATFDCEIIETLDMATHHVIFGRVRALGRQEGGRPLLFHERSYRVL